MVVTTLELPGTTDVVILLDPDQRPGDVLPWHPFQNIVRIASDGTVIWRSELVPGETTAKCWDAVDWVDGRLRATTYSYTCELDPASGRIVDSVFTK